MNSIPQIIKLPTFHTVSCEINDCLLCLTKDKCAICDSGFVLADNGITCKIFNATSPTVRPTSDYKILGLNTIATVVFCKSRSFIKIVCLYEGAFL